MPVVRSTPATRGWVTQRKGGEGVRAWLALFLGTVLAAASGAQGGSGHCLDPQTCDPYSSSCDQPCYLCLYDYPDYYCPQDQTTWISCGAISDACLTPGCTPRWVEIYRFQTGAKSDCYGFFCFYYHCFLLTERDENSCNINQRFRMRARAIRDQIGWYFGGCGCCDIFGGCWGSCSEN